MKKVLVIINISKETSMSLAQEISTFLKNKKVDCDFLSFDGFSENTELTGYDFVITLGGDGTVLYAARNCVKSDIPVFSVNLGQFGFLASVQQDNWMEELSLFLEGKAPVQERSLIKCSLIRENNMVTEYLALNDIVISAKNSARTVSLDVKYDQCHLCKLKSDGVIISTSTGSTAYSVSAGGPIVDPKLDAFVMTPINSFSLSSRPIVLSSEGEISIKVQPFRTKEICLIADGQEPVTLIDGDCLVIKKFDKKIKLINCTEEKFYDALRSKLNWTGGPHA